MTEVLKALSGEKCEKRLHRSPKFLILSVIIKSPVIRSASSTGLVYADDRLIQQVVSSSEQSIEIIGLRMDGQKAHWKTAKHHVSVLSDLLFISWAFCQASTG